MDTTEAQDALLYHAMWGKASEVFQHVEVSDFDPGPRQELAEILERGHLSGVCSAAWAKDEADRLGRPKTDFIALVATSMFTGSVGYYGQRLRESTIRRKAIEAMTRGLNLLNTGHETFDAIQVVKDGLQMLPQPKDTDDDAWTIGDIMGLDVQQRGFTLPNMLQENERLVLTGSEGGGKSVFVYQLLTGAAFGVDTFSLERTEPKRVLFVDVENNQFQARANLDKIVPALREIAPDVQPEWRSLKRRVIDLMATRDRADVIRRVVHYNPDILYMGTAYKLTDISDEAHRAVRAIQSVVDRIREEVECSVIVEHHAGHGVNNDRNSMRPEGSSYWLRWPDFGYGMVPLPTPVRMMRLRPWRGDRVLGRQWPAAVKQGDVLPWVPVYQDEFEARYAHLEN